jgi:hypothetical protein
MDLNFSYREALRPISSIDRGFSAGLAVPSSRAQPRACGAADPVRREDFIKMAVGADAVFDLMRFARLMSKRAIGNRISLRSTIILGV